MLATITANTADNKTAPAAISFAMRALTWCSSIIRLVISSIAVFTISEIRTKNIANTMNKNSTVEIFRKKDNIRTKTDVIKWKRTF